jgi:hypothetical protein
MLEPKTSVSGLIRKLKSRTIINSKTGCWEWQGAQDDGGYGLICWRGLNWRLHRLSAYLSLGLARIDTRQINHKCNNPSCWWWAHLYIGTQKDNYDDAMRAHVHSNWRRKC